MGKIAIAAIAAAAAALAACPAHAQDFPTIDADGQLGKAATGNGDLHADFDLSLANGDFSRGSYDDDAASLDRLPVHGALTIGWTAHKSAAGDPDLWLEASTSNGLHSAQSIERTSPRAWYESNNLAAVFYKPNKATTTALAYVIKTSPNGISPTTHELTASLGYKTDGGIGRLQPSTAVSLHTKGGNGLYTLFGIAPSFDLGPGDSPPTIDIPVRLGVGWDDFYGPGSGTAMFASAGLAFNRPFAVGTSHWKFHAEALALLRDRTVRNLGEADAEHSAVVPLATMGVSLSF